MSEQLISTCCRSEATRGETNQSKWFCNVCGKQCDVVDVALRDRFALVAMHGIICSGEPEDVDHNAIVAYRNADAMLKARKATP